MKKALIIIGSIIAFIVLVILLVAFGFIKFLDSIPETTLKDCDGETISVDKYRCYGLIAEYNKDPLICDKIPEDNADLSLLKAICYADVSEAKNDLSICDSLSGVSKFTSSTSNQDRCIGYVAYSCKISKEVSKLTGGNWEPSLICQEIQNRGIQPLEYQ